MKKLDLSNVKETEEYSKLTAGAYVCKICDVKDIEEKEYLKVTYDIAEGDFAGYYEYLRGKFPSWDWCGAYTKSYKTSALPMFKRFCSAVSKSNGSYVFDGGAVNADEKSLIGKKIGIVLREEEYYGNDGELKTRLIVYREFPVADLDHQKVPEVKRLEGSKKTTSADSFMSVPEVTAEKVPF